MNNVNEIIKIKINFEKPQKKVLQNYLIKFD